MMLNRRTRTFQKIFDFFQKYEFGTYWDREFRAYNRQDRRHYYRASRGQEGIEYVYEKNEASEPHTSQIMRKPKRIDSMSDFAFHLFKEIKDLQESPDEAANKPWETARRKR